LRSSRIYNAKPGGIERITSNKEHCHAIKPRAGVKDIDSHSVRALLASRALLVKIKRDLENQVRGLLKNLGLVIGRAKFNVFAARAEELVEDRPELVAAVRPLLEARKAVEQQVCNLDRKVLKLARRDAQVRRFMTTPGVGPITALCFKATTVWWELCDPVMLAKRQPPSSTRRVATLRDSTTPLHLAVFILMTSWKRVGCSTGKSAG
jgi:hypothetical protein